MYYFFPFYLIILFSSLRIGPPRKAPPATSSLFLSAPQPDASTSTSSTSDTYFDTVGFIKDSPSAARPFLSALLGTQAWQRFVDERTYAALALEVSHHLLFFHESLVEKRNRNTFTRSQPTPFLVSRVGEVIATLLCPPPNRDGIESDKIFLYTVFPRFNVSCLLSIL